MAGIGYLPPADRLRQIRVCCYSAPCQRGHFVDVPVIPRAAIHRQM